MECTSASALVSPLEEKQQGTSIREREEKKTQIILEKRMNERNGLWRAHQKPLVALIRSTCVTGIILLLLY